MAAKKIGNADAHKFEDFGRRLVGVTHDRGLAHRRTKILRIPAVVGAGPVVGTVVDQALGPLAARMVSAVPGSDRPYVVIRRELVAPMGAHFGGVSGKNPR